MTQNTMESLKEITPANLDERMTNNIKDLSKEIYDILGMKGIVRMDYIIYNELPLI